MSMNVDGASFIGFIRKPDAEWQKIIEKLWNVYGIRSSGSKALDKQILHQHELQDAQKESSVTSKFLTVTKAEQEKIQAKKKAKKVENEPKTNSNITQGAEILGKQIFLAIQMKSSADIQDNKRKRDNKYQS